MSDWRKGLDRRIEEAEARTRAAKQSEYDRLLKEHKKEFKCHICKKESFGPCPQPGAVALITGIGSIDYDYVLWSVPTGLERCTVCEKWACDETRSQPHIHKGVCKKCYEEGYLPGSKKKEKTKLGIFGL